MSVVVARRWALLGVAAFVLHLASSILSGFNAADEAWFLQVVTRHVAGEVLYRDIFLGTTPLSVQVGAWFAALFGTEAVALKIAGALCFAGTVLVTARIARQCRLEWPAIAPLLLALVLVDREAGSLYSGLASVLLLLGGTAVLSWRSCVAPGAARWWLAAAGVAAGLAAATKQNIGVYALAAVVLSIAVVRRGAWRRGLRDAGLAAAAFAVALVLPLVPVALSGGLPRLVEFGFTGKGKYLHVAGVPYWSTLTSTIHAFAAGEGRSVGRAADGLVFLLPPLAAIVLAHAWWRARGDGEARTMYACLALQLGAAWLGLFPRADRYHLTYVLPQALLALGVALSGRPPVREGRTPRRAIAPALSVVLALVIAVALVRDVRHAASPSYVFSRLPHFEHVLVEARDEARLSANAAALRAAGEGGGLFILAIPAATHYLVSGVPDPTAFDYPTVPAFSRGGEDQVIEAVRAGRIRTVALRTEDVVTERLETFVRERLHPCGAAGEFELYCGPASAD